MYHSMNTGSNSDIPSISHTVFLSIPLYKPCILQDPVSLPFS